MPSVGLTLTHEQVSLATHVVEPFDVTAILVVPEEEETVLPDGTDTVQGAPACVSS